VFENRNKDLRTALKTKLGMSSSPTDLDGLRHLRALQMSSSEIGADDKNSEDCEREGNTPVQGILQTDWKCLARASATL
jgi:hypothetical protein